MKGEQHGHAHGAGVDMPHDNVLSSSGYVLHVISCDNMHVHIWTLTLDLKLEQRATQTLEMLHECNPQKCPRI